MRVSEKGFTLIELIIVLAIVSILLAITVTETLRWREQAVFTNASNQIINLLRSARSKAVTRKFEHRVEINVTGGQVRLTRGNRSANSSSFTVVDGWSGFPPQVALRANSDCLGVTAVNFTFSPNGTGSSDGVTNDICVMQNGSPLIPMYRVSITSTTSGRTTMTRL